MTWLLIALLAAAALLPLGLAMLRPPPARGRREADLALYRAQLAELDRERAEGRLEEAAHRAAVLEVQRRLLAAPEERITIAAPTRERGVRLALLAAVVAVPAAALGLYLAGGAPALPSATFAARQEVIERDEALLATLRDRLAQLDPMGETARRGYVLLGNAERSRGRLEAAAAAYRQALAAGFDADLAAQLAQVLLEDGREEEAARFLAGALPRAPQHIGLRFLTGLAEAQAGRPEVARATWRALLADAPPDAPWRGMVERRMAELP
ncbi:c-type cytochrome biogenesis protein CcmI [Crenalkalicoccus roseus]|uniref:c-type cytochrome biogenesis protein CcmI n=1 Tax=Crenalkalicoccus roseus TaxID=1485588 RepID=UPI00107FD538|nr:c-type cytochrome biogenesis protein CcmI [Crenalkalicoccus roseus]